jgi:hypothetical protein
MILKHTLPDGGAGNQMHNVAHEGDEMAAQVVDVLRARKLRRETQMRLDVASCRAALGYNLLEQLHREGPAMPGIDYRYTQRLQLGEAGLRGCRVIDQ